MDEYRNRIICGDNCDVMGQFPRGCVDLVVTSPPYDGLRTYGGHSWDFFGVAWQLKRVLKPGGVIVWVVADQTKDGSETGTSMEQALHFKRLGLNLHDTMIYATDKPPLTHNRYEQSWEYCFVLSNGTPKTFNPILRRTRTRGSLPGKFVHKATENTYSAAHKQARTGETTMLPNLWYYTSGIDENQTRGHPAPFPVALAKDFVQTWSNPGDIVLDPFSGSGTTPKAAKELGRNFVGIEVNPDYCAISERRLAQGVLPFGFAQSL